MSFLIWHILAIISVMGISFGMGYYTGKIKERNNALR